MRFSALKTTLFVALLTMSSATVSAQLLQATRSHYSTEDGLCSNAIADLVQDDYGYIWIATWNGLSRFDGYHFYNYKTGARSHIPNLHNRILHLSIDQQQNVWMHMYDNRVFMMKRSTDRIVNPFEGINGNEEYRTTSPITIAKNGDVLVSIDGVGIYCIQPESDKLNIRLITTSGLNITSMAEGYQGDIWLGTDQGIHRLDAGNMTVERKGFFLDEYVTCIFSNGFNVYAGTRSGKILTFAYGREPEELRSGGPALKAIYADSHGLLWFCDDRKGASSLDPVTKLERHFEQVVLIPDYDGSGGSFHESAGILWVHLNHGGYGYYNRETGEIEYFHNDPSNPWNLTNTINASLELEEGVVFESTSRRGLEKLEIMKNTIGRKLLVPQAGSNLENETRALFYDKERHLLLIGNKASQLFFYNDEGELTRTITQDDTGHPIGRCYGLSKDAKGNYWLASKDYGLFCITPNGQGFSVKRMSHSDDDPGSLSSDNAYATVEDGQGNIWVATYGGGVNVLTRSKNGKMQFLHPKNGMVGYPHRSHLKVRAIALNKDGKVWAGTTDGILIMSCKNGDVSIQQLEESEQHPDSILQSNDIVCMGTDVKGDIWIGTNGGGLAHVTGQDEQGRWLFSNYGTSEGLPSEEIKSLTSDSKGNIWFATDNVLCSFDTEAKVFTTFSSLDGVDETICSEGAAVITGNDNVLIGTVNGYYVIDRKKLVNSDASTLKLHITDFFVNEVLQSPRLTNEFSYYVPESKEVTLNDQKDHIQLRFAAMNYQLQHRIHYQYMLEGYDKDWHNADNDRTANYQDLPAGRYTFMVRAFLLESPEKADVKKLVINVPAPYLLSSRSFWIWIVLAVVVIALLIAWRIRKNRKPLKRKNKKEEQEVKEADNSDQYELIND